MLATTSKTVIRGTDSKDKAAIKVLRKRYSEVLLEDPAVRYMAAERDGKITAIYGVKIDKDNPSRALVVDFYGTNAWDWMKLCRHLLSWADHFGIQLSGWCSTQNPHLRLFHRLGFSDSAVLIRREAH